MYFPQQQPRLPAAARTESLLDHRGGASNTTDAQADSIVGKFLLWLPGDSSVELGIGVGHTSSRGKLTLKMNKGRKWMVYPNEREPGGWLSAREGESLYKQSAGTIFSLILSAGS